MHPDDPTKSRVLKELRLVSRAQPAAGTHAAARFSKGWRHTQHQQLLCAFLTAGRLLCERATLDGNNTSVRHALNLNEQSVTSSCRQSCDLSFLPFPHTSQHRHCRSRCVLPSLIRQPQLLHLGRGGLQLIMTDNEPRQLLPETESHQNLSTKLGASRPLPPRSRTRPAPSAVKPPQQLSAASEEGDAVPASTQDGDELESSHDSQATARSHDEERADLEARGTASPVRMTVQRAVSGSSIRSSRSNPAVSDIPREEIEKALEGWIEMISFWRSSGQSADGRDRSKT